MTSHPEEEVNVLSAPRPVQEHQRFGLQNDDPSAKTPPSPASASSSVGTYKPLLSNKFSNHTILDSRLTSNAFEHIDRTESEIQQFVTSLPTVAGSETLVDWGIPQRPRKEADLYTPIKMAIAKITRYFGLNIHRAVFIAAHDNEEEDIMSTTDESVSSSPNICIQAVVDNAKGKNNFPYSLEDKRERHQLCVSPIEVRTESHFKTIIIRQTAVHARQIFISQGNRRFVNCFVLTEKHLRLYVFARDGLQYSDKFDIHQHPARFVRYILGAASLDGNIVGFDSSVYWENGERYIDVSQCTPNLGVLRLVEPDPVFDRRTIRGRGTTCWKGEPCSSNNVANGVSYIIKDSWRLPAKCQVETELLKEVVGLDGVGQMVAFNGSVTTISAIRNIDKGKILDNVSKGLKDMILSRIVIECYGRTLEAFRSRLQLVQAFQDTVVGYCNLFDEAKVLHRDISVKNVLLGKPGASAGNQGIIIDLDMAIRRDRDESKSLNGTEDIKGTRPFQSLHLLMHCPEYPIKGLAPHNFMDDLESLFYVLCWVCESYCRPGNFFYALPKSLVMWQNNEPAFAEAAKWKLYWVGLKVYFDLPEYYKGAVYNLIEGLFKIFQSRYDRNQYHCEDSDAERIFKEILDLCKQAIRKLEQEPEDGASTADFHPSEKRPLTQSQDEQGPRKRPRTESWEAPLA